MAIPSPSSKRAWHLDWTQYIFPGPTRRFSAEELARGGLQPWPRGLDQYAFINAGLMVVVSLLNSVSPPVMASMAMLSIAFPLLAVAIGRWLWVQPSRLRLNVAGQLSGLGFVAYAFGIDAIGLERKDRFVLLLVAAIFLVMVVVGWFAVALWRVQQIEGRLRELDDLEAQKRLQRRLATAQIHPHFVFNTLASLTHWVETQDARAAPLLKRFSAYLRATLPMFERESQPLSEELQLVRDYLAIMQARMGSERLQVQVEHDPSLDALLLPPGSLLTLVENAVTHGIEPALAGGRIGVRSEREAGHALISVCDSGEGLAPDFEPGLGLSNTRERLLALHAQARLSLSPLQPKGCQALMEIPL